MDYLRGSGTDMDIEVLRRELKSIDTLVADGIIKPEKGEMLKDKITDRFLAEYDTTDPQKLPDDLAHLPGRLIAGVFDALKNINGARCAGVDVGQRSPQKQARSPGQMMDELPDIYK